MEEGDTLLLVILILVLTPVLVLMIPFSAHYDS